MSGPRLCGIGDEAGRDLDAQLTVLGRLGWRLLELRTVGGAALCDLDDEEFARLAAKLAGAGVEVPCVASRIGGWTRAIDAGFAADRDELLRLLPRCVLLRTPYLRVMSWKQGGAGEREWGDETVRRLSWLAERAADAGVTLVHENCTGWAATDPGRIERLLTEVRGLRLLFDTGNGIPYGYDALQLLRPFLPAVAHVHVKDAVRTESGCAYVPPGQGETDVAGCLRALREHGYAGAYSLEPHVGLRPHLREGATDVELAEGFVASGRALSAMMAQTAVPA